MLSPDVYALVKRHQPLTSEYPGESARLGVQNIKKGNLWVL